MIQNLQKLSQSRVAKIFLALVALSFMVFFGGGKWFQSRDPHAIVAEVGSIVISQNEFAQKVQEQIHTIVAQTKGSVSREDLLKEGLPQMVLNQLIRENLLNLEAERLGLTVSDEVMRHHIQSIKAFQNKKGEFDRALFTQLLRTNGFSEDAFIAMFRQDLVREQLIDAIMVGAYIPDEMVDHLFEAQYQYRQASMLLVSPNNVPSPPLPSQKELEAFYNDHQKEFTLPELRTLTALVLDPTHLMQNISVTEEEIQSVYDAKMEAFGKKPLEEVKSLVIADIQKEKASEQIYQLSQELDDKIAGGATLEELASSAEGVMLVKLELIDANGYDASMTPSPLLSQDEELAQDILQTGFSLEDHTDSPFSQAQNGIYYMVRVDTITPPALPSFDAIKEHVQNVWSQIEQFKAAKAKAETYANSFNGGDRKAELLTLLPNLSLSEPSPAVPDEVKNLVFSLSPHQAGVVETPSGFAVVVLNTIIPSDPKIRQEKLEPFKAQLLTHYKDDLLMAYLNALHIRHPVKINKAAITALFAPQI